MRPWIPTALAILVSAPSLVAQAEHDHGDHASPYAGAMEAREIKSLGEDEVRGLLEGEGLGYALAAELNGVPGPRHVLEMVGELELTPRQRREVEAVRERMVRTARELGVRIVEEERHLDRMFARGHAAASDVEEATLRIATLRGRLRSAHLVAHLETAAVLSADQVARYAELRGYAGSSTP